MSLNRREFIKNAAKGALLSSSPLLLPHKAFAAVDTKDRYGLYKPGKWRNWSHNVEVSPKNIAKPLDLAGLKALVGASQKIRAFGSAHSISSIASSEDTLIDTSGFNQIVSLDPVKRTVTVQGGMKLKAFSNELAQRGYALPSTGDTFYQSLAGLLSTGTHGTGMKWGSCSDEESLAGMELVLADGSVKSLSAENSDDRELLEAARISLGSLGIVHTVTLKVDQVHNLEHRGTHASVPQVLGELQAKLAEYDHYEFAYFPYADECYEFQRKRTEQKANDFFAAKWFREDFLEGALAGVILKLASKDPSKLPDVSTRFLKAFKDSHLVDRCDRVMTIPRTTPSYLMEIAIPIDHLEEAMRQLREQVDEYAKKPKGQQFFLPLPAQVRFVRGDRGTLLSATGGKDTCWFGIGSYIAFQGQDPFFVEWEKRLLRLGGRPHWGKYFFQNPSKLYGTNFEKFEAIRKKLDPSGKFKNKYVARLLDTEATNLAPKFF